MQILIPMGGAGSRFSSAGYTTPKPFIEFHGKTMIENVIENLGHKNEYFLIMQRAHYQNYKHIFDELETRLNSLHITLLDGLTEGPADTCLRAKDFLDYTKPVFIANSDQIQFMKKGDNVQSILRERNLDGLIFIFDSQSPKNSYARINELGLVTRTAEKEVISEFATSGIYIWSRAGDFIKHAQEMINRNIRANNEFYCAPVYNISIEHGAKIGLYRPLAHYPIGTPEDLEVYLTLFPNKPHSSGV